MIFFIIITLLLMGCSCEHPNPPQDWDSPFTQLWSSEEYQWVGTTQASSPLPLGDSLVFMSIGGDVVMVEQETGKIRWKTHVADLTNIQSNVFKTDGERIYATHTQDVRAFDIVTGEIVWLIVAS